MEVLATILSILALLAVGPLAVLMYFENKRLTDKNLELATDIETAQYQISSLNEQLTIIRNSTDIARLAALELKVGALQMKR